MEAYEDAGFASVSDEVAVSSAAELSYCVGPPTVYPDDFRRELITCVLLGVVLSAGLVEWACVYCVDIVP